MKSPIPATMPKRNRRRYGYATNAICDGRFVSHALIDDEANVNEASANAVLPLHLAARNGEIQKAKAITRQTHFSVVRQVLCIKKLLVDGADVKAEDDDGWTPLHTAARYGHRKIVQVSIGRHCFCLLGTLSFRFSWLTGRTSRLKTKTDGHRFIWQCVTDIERPSR